ncbi:MAG: hypothetical protein JETCAE02_28100 [Anaerolineaceae bacterium]|nr:MAG: hypothetical protein BroJett001_30940 [Chloroflexota bacterium]GJQ40398.1 MAG: hypothetical protein JETCAE02_28100 [Anaerolineaceae bacterium]
MGVEGTGEEMTGGGVTGDEATGGGVTGGAGEGEQAASRRQKAKSRRREAEDGRRKAEGRRRKAEGGLRLSMGIFYLFRGKKAKGQIFFGLVMLYFYPRNRRLANDHNPGRSQTPISGY